MENEIVKLVKVVSGKYAGNTIFYDKGKKYIKFPINKKEIIEIPVELVKEFIARGYKLKKA